MRLAVIIPAAGASTRYRQDLAEAGVEAVRSKLDEDLGGRPVLQRTVELFTGLEATAMIVVAGPADEEAMEAFRQRHADKLGLLGCRLVRGGVEHRAQSVASALASIPDDAGITHVAVHDAARPCTPSEVIERVLRAAETHAAVIPALPVSDTLKAVEDLDGSHEEVDAVEAILGAGPRRSPLRVVVRTLDRRGLVSVQTPQVFQVGLLRRAYAQADLTGTDDAQLVERLGQRVVVVPGDPRNIKITRPGDVALARAILGVRAPEAKPAHRRF
jgi:2-C-methyl-D-erythritol 4-phosphate cytidylyltransferase